MTFDKALEWFIKEVLAVLFVLFCLSLIGMEFNEYPHTDFELKTDNKIIEVSDYSNLTFCPHWNKTHLEKVTFGYGQTCYEIMEWINPKENRITYFNNYEIRLIGIWESKKEAEIELIDMDRAFLIIQGKRKI